MEKILLFLVKMIEDLVMVVLSLNTSFLFWTFLDLGPMGVIKFSILCAIQKTKLS